MEAALELLEVDIYSGVLVGSGSLFFVVVESVADVEWNMLAVDTCAVMKVVTQLQ